MSGGFVMVPGWLRAKKPTGNAILAYINLASRGTWNPGTGCYEECRPKLDTLASDMGVSVSTAQRGLDELLALGAVTKRIRHDPITRSQLPSMYRVVFGSIVEPPLVTSEQGGVVTGDQPPLVTGDHPPWSPVTDDLEPLTKNPETKRKILAALGSEPPTDATKPADAQLALIGEIVTPTPSTDITRGFVDYCAANGVKLTNTHTKRYAAKIKELREAGFDDHTIKHALAAMHADATVSRPHLLDHYIVRVQTGPEKPPARMTRTEAAIVRNAPPGMTPGDMVRDALTRPA